jgi:hypothetical protein
MPLISLTFRKNPPHQPENPPQKTPQQKTRLKAGLLL